MAPLLNGVYSFKIKALCQIAMRSNLGYQNKPYTPEVLKIECSEFSKMNGLIIPREHHWESMPWKILVRHGLYVNNFDYLASFISFDGDTNSKQWVQVKFNERALAKLKAK
jgi:hypothetical protein